MKQKAQAGEEITKLRRDLLEWWDRHQRNFPWRSTRDPYHIFAAEVLLHRTRADQVVPLYHAMLDRYPTIDDLAVAVPDTLHRLLHAGGLRWRVDLLLACAQVIHETFAGQIPNDMGELQSLPGIGHYISSAIRCFAFGHADPVIDTNSVRVLARVYGINITDNLRRSKAFHELAEAALDPQQPREFNFALLDLAALICKPRNPKCVECPLLQYCAYSRGALQTQSAAKGASSSGSSEILVRLSG